MYGRHTPSLAQLNINRFVGNLYVPLPVPRIAAASRTTPYTRNLLSYLTYIPVDETNPLISYPTDSSFGGSATTVNTNPPRTFTRYLWDNSSPGQTPFNLQPNGMFFFTLAFHSSNVNTPGISSSIRGTINYQIEITTPLCDAKLQRSSSNTFTVQETVASVAPYRYTWRSRTTNTVFANSITAKSITVDTSNWAKGKHVIEVSGVDGQNVQARATVRIYIAQVDGEPCTEDLQCLSDHCTDSTCCTQESCSGHGTCSNPAGSCICDVGYAGDDCSQCATNHYGPTCKYCVAATTCSGHG